jgi:hypothetical protein
MGEIQPLAGELGFASEVLPLQALAQATVACPDMAVLVVNAPTSSS